MEKAPKKKICFNWFAQNRDRLHNPDELSFQAIGKELDVSGVYVKKKMDEYLELFPLDEDFPPLPVTELRNYETQQSEVINLEEEETNQNEPRIMSQIVDGFQTTMHNRALKGRGLTRKERRKMPTPAAFKSQWDKLGVGIFNLTLKTIDIELDEDGNIIDKDEDSVDKLSVDEEALCRSLIRRIEWEVGGGDGDEKILTARVQFLILMLTLLVNRADKISNFVRGQTAMLTEWSKKKKEQKERESEILSQNMPKEIVQ